MRPLVIPCPVRLSLGVTCHFRVLFRFIRHPQRMFRKYEWLSRILRLPAPAICCTYVTERDERQY